MIARRRQAPTRLRLPLSHENEVLFSASSMIRLISSAEKSRKMYSAFKCNKFDCGARSPRGAPHTVFDCLVPDKFEPPNISSCHPDRYGLTPQPRVSLSRPQALLTRLRKKGARVFTLQYHMTGEGWEASKSCDDEPSRRLYSAVAA